jgi:hypothetical protein
MSIDYMAKPIEKIKYLDLKSEILKNGVSGLKYEESDKATTIPKGYDSFVIDDGQGDYATVYKMNNGNVLLTFYGLTENVPWYILYKLSRHYKCDMVDEQGADGNASDFLALWKKERPHNVIGSTANKSLIRGASFWMGRIKSGKKSVKKKSVHARLKAI